MNELFPDSIKRDASFSQCGKYRWTLSRSWGAMGEPWVGWIGLNPSTADGTHDDATIRKCMKFTRAWGYTGMTMMNLFGFRATEPADMMRAPYPIAPRGGELKATCTLLCLPKCCPLIIAAWGVDGNYLERATDVTGFLSSHDVMLHHLGRTKDGHPRHPLYVRDDTWPEAL